MWSGKYAATGWGHSVEMAGSSHAFDTGYRITKRGWLTEAVGLAASAASFSLPAVGLVAEERTLNGSYVGGCVPLRDVPCFTALYESERLPEDPLPSSTGSLDDIDEGFDLFHLAKVVRHVIDSVA